MTRRAILALTLLVLLTLAAPAVAQSNGFTIESVDTGDHPEVALTVSVETQLLGQSTPDFVIREDGQIRPVSVEAAASDDLKVVIAVDVSGSMRGEPLSAARTAVTQFIAEMPSSVQIAIVAFGDSPSLVAEFTDDKPTLLAAIDLLTARGETALYDGLAAASILLESEDREGRTIVLVSDGGDTVSSSSLSQVTADLNRLGAAFYAVELQSPENDSEALKSLADAAAGTVIAADDPAALESLFGDIASELLSSYRLVFTSESYGSAPLQVEVLASGVVLGTTNRVLTYPDEPVAVTPEPEVDPVPVEPAPAPRPEPVSVTTVELSWLESPTAGWLSISAIFLAVAIVFSIVALRPRTPRAARASMLSTTSSKKAPSKSTGLSVIAESATALAEQTLHRGDRLTSVNASLERAGVALRPGEFVVMVVSGALAAAAVGVILVNAALGLALAGVVVLVVPMWLSSKSSERSSLFNDQLGDTLQLMSSSMRAGYGLLQAVDAVAEEAASPTAEEFQRIKIETHLGRDLDDSLKAAAARVDSEDFRWVAEAIEIHRQIGGDLAEILDAVAETIRDRNRIRRRVKALSAEGRISAVILSAIPIVLAIVITFINPSYIGELPDTGLGQFLIVAGIIAWFIAVLWMRRIVRLVF